LLQRVDHAASDLVHAKAISLHVYRLDRLAHSGIRDTFEVIEG
jgi:hypothetical protein